MLDGNLDDTVVIIPTYNEADNIGRLIRKLKNIYIKHIVVVDDNSPDGTAVKAKAAGARVIVRTTEKGLSSAVIKGIRETTEGNIVVMDADLQHPPEMAWKLAIALGPHDLVIGSRHTYGGGIIGWSIIRRLVSWAANLLAYPLVPKIKDRSTGLFGFRRKCVDANKLNPLGFKIALEVMIKGAFDSVVEVPYVFVPRLRGESKLKGRQITEYIKQLAQLYFRSRLLRFLMVGASGAVVKLGLTYFYVDIGGLHYLLGYAVAFIVSVINNYYWNSRYTFKDRQSSMMGFWKYLTTSTATLTVNELIIYALTDLAGLWYLFSAMVGVLTACALNFVFCKKWVWNK